MFRLQKVLSKHFSLTLKSPINIELLKNEPGIKILRDSIKNRFKSQQILDNLQKQYEEYRKNLYEYENLSKDFNSRQKRMKQFQKQKDQNAINNLKLQIATIKQKQHEKEQRVKELKNTVEGSLMKVGNVVHQDVVISQNEDQNRVLKYYHPSSLNIGSLNPKQIQNFYQHSCKNKSATSYQQLNQIFGISDLKRGQKVSGHRGYFLKVNGLKLALALAQYGLSFLEERGYECLQTPALILQDVLKESCQLQTIETDLYKVNSDNLCLIATSQQSLAGYYRGQTIEQKNLSIKLAGYSTCFRKQAGAHGKDIHGLFRVHQFEKVEQFVICKDKDSENEMKKMLQVSEQFYQSLGIPYRVIDIVSGELNDPAIRKWDLEAWYPSQKKFRELVSISNCTDYQSRLLQVRYRQSGQNKYPHMLNGTLVAIQRTITCLLQNYYNSETQKIEVPQVLKAYMGKQKLIV